MLQGGFVSSVATGFVLTTLLLTLALSWWYGGKLVSEGDSQVNSVGDVVEIFYSVIIGSLAFATIAPSIKVHGYCNCVSVMLIVIQ